MRPLSHAVLAVLFLAAPAAAQTTKALDLVPEDALGFILVKDLRGLSDNVEQLAQKLKVTERVSFLDLIHREIGVTEGLNDKGSAVFIVMEGKDKKSSPHLVLALPVADAEKVQRQLGVKQVNKGIGEGEVGGTPSLFAGLGKGSSEKGKEAKKLPVLVAAKSSFVLLAPRDQGGALERVMNCRKSVTASVQQARDWLEEQEVCGVCTHHGIQVGLAMLLGGPGGVVGSSTPGQFASMKASYADFEKNVRLIAFGARIGKTGNPRLRTRVYFAPDGTYAKWLAKAEALKGKALTQLPSQQYLLAVLARISRQTNFEGLTKQFWEGLSADEQTKQLSLDAARLLQQISEVGVGVYADWGNKKDSAPADFHAAVIARVDDASKFVNGTVDLLEKTRRGMNRADKNQVELQIQYQQRRIAGKPSRLITFRSVSTKAKDADPKPAKSAEASPWAILLTEIDPRTVLVCCLTSADQAEAAVKRFTAGSEKPLSADAALQKTSVLLPPRRQVAAYLNVQTLGLFGYTLPTLPESPPLGFALSTFRDGVEAEFVVPFGTLQALFDSARQKEKK